MLQVLVIDDDPTQLRIREAVLRSAGFSVAVATTAEDAKVRLRDQESSFPFQVIVTDHMLTGDSGAVLVRQIREVDWQIPVVVVTGLREAEKEYAGLNITFLEKPCAPEQLIRTVKNAAGQNL